MKNKSILLVGGGSGGHFVPIFTLYKYLKKTSSEAEIFVIGSGNEMEREYFGDDSSYLVITTGKMHRFEPIKNLLEIFKYICGICQAYKILKQVKPVVIFSKGGFVAMPVVFWAKILKIPYFIHESDIEMGRTNLYAAKKASKIFTGFPIENYINIPKDRAVYVGQILRPELFENPKIAYKFSTDRPILLITGGSQGSANINKSVLGALPNLLTKYNIIHQLGFGKEIENTEGMNKSYKPFQFLNSDEMIAALQMSDLIVSRASATTVAEAAALAKPMLLVPYKYAAADHQTKNAQAMEKSNAARILSDDELTPTILEKTILDMFSDSEALRDMGQQASKFFPTDGLKQIAEEIIKSAKRVG